MLCGYLWVGRWTEGELHVARGMPAMGEALRCAGRRPALTGWEVLVNECMHAGLMNECRAYWDYMVGLPSMRANFNCMHELITCMQGLLGLHGGAALAEA